MLGGLGGGGLVIRLDGGDGDVGLDTGVEGDDRDALAIDLVQEVGGSLGVKGGEADGGRAGVQSGLQLVGLLGHLGLVLRANEVHLVAQLLASLLGAFLHGLPEAVLEALGDEVDGLGAVALDRSLLPVLHVAGGVDLGRTRGLAGLGVRGGSGGVRRGRAGSQAQGHGADGGGGEDTSDGAHWFSFRGGRECSRLSGG